MTKGLWEPCCCLEPWLPREGVIVIGFVLALCVCGEYEAIAEKSVLDRARMQSFETAEDLPMSTNKAILLAPVVYCVSHA